MLKDRDENKVRYFSELDIKKAALVHCLRQTGMSAKNIKYFLLLCLKGETSIKERLEICQSKKIGK